MYFVPYQSTEIECIAVPHRHGRYVPLPHLWGALEACWGCYIELPPIFTYTVSSMVCVSHSGFWSVVVTERPVHTAAYILAEAYDQYRL